MKVITVVSSDKITQHMFSSYMKTLSSLSEVVILELNSLFSSEVQNKALNSAIEYVNSTNRSNSIVILVKYRVKGNSSIDSNIEKISDIVVKFDIFSTYPEVLKEGPSYPFSEFNLGWLNYVESFNTRKR